MKPLKPNQTQNRRKYDTTFKLEAVQNWLSSGKSAEVVAEELGLNPSRLYAWRKLLPPAPAGGGKRGRGAGGAGPGPARGCLAGEPPSARAARYSKKNSRHTLRTLPERFERVHAMRNEHSILKLCEALQVSPSGFYDWDRRRRRPGPRALENQALAQEVVAIHTASRQTYGSPRVVEALRSRGRRHGRNRVARIMKGQGLRGRQKARYRLRTTDSNHDHPIAPNRLAEAPATSAPNQIWVADITYIPTREGWLFLAAVLDLHSRRIVGWAMGPSIDSALVLSALNMALLHRDPPPGLLFHSDRGVQYAAGNFRAALAHAGFSPSMSRRGNCYDNAAMESFWSTLKIELVYRRDFATHRQARSEIFDYIEAFYNPHRIHTSLAGLSPANFELKNH